MAKKHEAPEAKELRRFVMAVRDVAELRVTIRRLDVEKYSALRAIARECAEDVCSRLFSAQMHGSAMIMALEFDVEPTVVAELFSEPSDRGWIYRAGEFPHLLPSLLDKNSEWARQFVDSLIDLCSPLGFAWASLLIDPLVAAHSLPLPQARNYWLDWGRYCVLPGEGRRWSDAFVTACGYEGALSWRLGQKKELLRHIHEGGACIRESEGLDEKAIVTALLDIIERQERSVAQSNVALFLEGLGLGNALWEQHDRLFAALPMAHSSVIAFACSQFLPRDLSEEEMTQLSNEVLTRKEKAPRKIVLKALSAYSTPVNGIIDALEAVSHEADTTIARAAQTILDKWGAESPLTAETIGLWKEPVGAPEPLKWGNLILDDPALKELLTATSPDMRETGEAEEYLCAALVATAYERGREAVMAQLDDDGRWDVYGVINALDGGYCWPRSRPTGRLAQKYGAAIATRLGEIPTLLATPTHRDRRVEWPVFIERLEKYAEADIRVEPSDLLIALTRLPREEIPVDLPDLPVRIRESKITVGKALRHYLTHPWECDLRILPERENGQSNYYAGTNIRRTPSDIPTIVRLLHCGTVWGCENDGGDEIPEAARLIPAFASDAALSGLRALVTYGANWATSMICGVLSCAHPVTPVVALSGLALAASVSPSGRERVADAFITAWDDGRLTSDHLVQAWGREWASQLELSPARLVATLTVIAEGGGLALVWPLMVAMAEEMALESKPLAATARVLETLLHFLPEVKAVGVSVDLPAVSALAQRKGKTKAVTVARLIHDQIGEAHE
ncbi:MAG: DUF6493 family protein [Actinomycetaceae bacterium]|nr:DUF6493 family protein [Actinomycetaceae bacterium]